MAIWKCGVCFEDIEEPDAVCHRCGRILCSKVNVCRYSVSDSVFASTDRKSYCCPYCRKQHAPGVGASGPGR